HPAIRRLPRRRQRRAGRREFQRQRRRREAGAGGVTCVSERLVIDDRGAEVFPQSAASIGRSPFHLPPRRALWYSASMTAVRAAASRTPTSSGSPLPLTASRYASNPADFASGSCSHGFLMSDPASCLLW